MPTKDDPRITVRLDEHLRASLQDVAKEEGVSVGEIVRRILTNSFGGPSPATIDRAFAKIPGNGPTIMGPPSLHCPVSDCHYAALSPKARCPHHNRLVV